MQKSRFFPSQALPKVRSGLLLFIVDPATTAHSAKGSLASVLRNLISPDPAIVSAKRLAEIDPYLAVREISSVVHSRAAFSGTQGQGTTPREIWEDLRSHGSRYLCGGLSAALDYAIEVVGIESRTVQLLSEAYLDGSDVGAAHVMVEAQILGEWVLFDPFFNATYQCPLTLSNEALGIRGILTCIREGHVPQPNYIGFSKRLWRDYRFPLEDLLYAGETSDGTYRWDGPNSRKLSAR